MARAAREEGEGGTDLRQVDFSLFSFSVDFNIVNGYNLSRERILERADRNTFLYDPEHRLLFCRNAKVDEKAPARPLFSNAHIHHRIFGFC